jgi:aspartokinase
MCREYKIIKIGGSLLRQMISYAQVVDAILASRLFPIVVVVSAMAGMTDHLKQVAESLGITNKRDVDVILGAGEIMSTLIMSSTFSSRNVSVATVTPLDRDWPIITDSNFGDATPDEKLTATNLKRLFLKERQSDVVVFSGFLGRDSEGNLTTLGRGGSDTTAVLIGHCMGWQVNLMKVDAALRILQKDGEGRLINGLSITRTEFERFLTSHPGFVCCKALKYMESEDRVSLGALSRTVDEIAIDCSK